MPMIFFLAWLEVSSYNVQICGFPLHLFVNDFSSLTSELFYGYRTRFQLTWIFEISWDLLVGLKLWPVSVSAPRGVLRKNACSPVAAARLLPPVTLSPVNDVQISNVCVESSPLAPSDLRSWFPHPDMCCRRLTCVNSVKNFLALCLWAPPMEFWGSGWKEVERESRALALAASSCGATWQRWRPSVRGGRTCQPSPLAIALTGVGDQVLFWAI